MLKDRRTYEIMRPEDVGVPQTTLVLGKHSGRHAVKHRCEQLGITLTRIELDQVYRRVIALADAQKTFADAELPEHDHGPSLVSLHRAPNPPPSLAATPSRRSRLDAWSLRRRVEVRNAPTVAYRPYDDALWRGQPEVLANLGSRRAGNYRCNSASAGGSFER